MPETAPLLNPGSLPMAFVRNCLILWLGLSLPAWGAAVDDFIRQLPDPAAKQGTATVSRADAEKLLRGIQPPPEDKFRCENLLKQKILERHYQTLLRDFLKKEGFDPAALPAKTFLSRATGLPEDAPELNRAAQDPENALRLAWQCYLAAKHPEILQITPREVETFYRNHPESFRRPAQIRQQIFHCPDRAAAEIVRFRAQQGQSAQQIAGDLPGIRVQEMLITETAAAGDWQFQQGADGSVRLIRQQKLPETMQTLSEASGKIRSTLLTRHSARMMSHVLKKLLAEQPVQFFF